MRKTAIILTLCLILGCESSQERQYRAEMETEHKILELQHRAETEKILLKNPEFREALSQKTSVNTEITPHYSNPPIYLYPVQSGPSSEQMAMEWILRQQEDYRYRQQQRKMDLYMLNMMNSLSGIDSSLEDISH